MSWTLLVVLVAVLGFAFFLLLSRQLELARMHKSVRTRERAVELGGAEAQLRHPVVDLSRCLGCGTCVAACPEEDVLSLVHGQAMVVNGAHCQGIAACERECPVGAITVTLSNVAERRDIPALSDGLEALGAPGLFLAGEVTAHALIKTAIEHGTAVAAEVGRRSRETPSDGALDLCIVGAGPAGLACALEAKRLGLRFVTLDQEGAAGGTVAKYPRRKLVLTQPVDLPLVGRLASASYTKEELIGLWQRIAVEHELPIRGDTVVTAVERDGAGRWAVRTDQGVWVAHHVCLALGRRGSPRKLGVPGEELPKVAYSLLDAHSYTGRRVLVVGGGDSAVETALGLAEQPGNEVTLSYRKDEFFRVRARNAERLRSAAAKGRLGFLMRSEVTHIERESVRLRVGGPDAPRDVRIPNDEVFVMIGGVAPFGLLEGAGVSFDPTLRPPPERVFEQGTGLMRALGAAFVLALATLAWALWNLDYYVLPLEHRPTHEKHTLLRPGMGFGLWMGLVALGCIGLNLLYLVRRAQKPRFPVWRLGSLRGWMTVHVATGVLALLCALLHAAMAPRDTIGGHAFQALAVLLVTGAIGRYLYAYVPRATNGRELALEEVKAKLGRLSAEWDQGQQRFREHVRRVVFEAVERRQWKSNFLSRALALVGVQRDLRRALASVVREGRAQGIAEGEIEETVELARRAWRTALMASHFEDVRAVTNSWRWLHRWVAALLVLLVLLHVLFALLYSAFLLDGGLT